MISDTGKLGPTNRFYAYQADHLQEIEWEIQEADPSEQLLHDRIAAVYVSWLDAMTPRSAVTSSYTTMPSAALSGGTTYWRRCWSRDTSSRGATLVLAVCAVSPSHRSPAQRGEVRRKKASGSPTRP
jgi:hypothetical protein